MNGQTHCGGQALYRASLAANDNNLPIGIEQRRDSRASRPAVPGFLHMRVISGVAIQTRAHAGIISGIYTEPVAHDASLFELRLHLKSGRSLSIGVHSEEMLIAEWRRASEIYGLPMLAQEADGLFQAIIPMFGGLHIGTDRRRRRVAALTSRRPRFLTRRKTARLPNLPAIHGGAPLGLEALSERR